MKNNFKFYCICWGLLLLVFNVICFVTPNYFAGMSKFGGGFWVGYIFIMLAFVGQLACAYMAFKEENLKKLFYNIPLILVSYTSLMITIVLGAACMIIPGFPSWISIIICFVVLAFSMVSVIKAKVSAEIVSDMDEKIHKKTSFIRMLTVDAENIYRSAETDKIKAECKKVYEAIRYSDPMSCEEVKSIELQIADMFHVFSDAVLKKEEENLKVIADKIVSLIEKRNRKCKALK